MHFLLRWLMVREIVSREGNVHFRRYRLLWTPRGAVYVHHILVSDQDKHPPMATPGISLPSSCGAAISNGCGNRVYVYTSFSL